MTNCNVYIAKYPFPYNEDIYCSLRKEEIEKCRNSDVKEQKFYVWKLLEYALSKTFGLGKSTLNFQKKNNGKWILEGYNFSLSHSGNIVVVAVSDYPIGVDIQKIKTIDDPNKFKSIILSKKEKDKYQNAKNEKLMKIWSLKECAFKRSNDSNFVPNRYEIDDLTHCDSFILELQNEKYILSTLCDNISEATYLSLSDDLKLCKTRRTALVSIVSLSNKNQTI